MTHLHLSTLGQCLILLARQGIKEPLYRVLRFVESGTIVPNFQKPTSQSDNLANLEKTKDKKTSSVPILTNQVKVSFKKASNILDQINQIQQQPAVGEQQKELPPEEHSFPPNYSTEEQCNDIQQIVDSKSPMELYLKNQLNQLQEHLELIKSHQVNQDYLQQVQNEVQFLEMTQELCQCDYSSLQLQGQIEEFTILQYDISFNVSDLSDPIHVLQIMKEFNLSFFESDKCLQFHNVDLSLSISYLKKLFYTSPKSFIKIPISIYIFNTFHFSKIQELEKKIKILENSKNPPLVF